MPRIELRGRWHRHGWVNLALAALFVVLALIVRWRALNEFITPDELKWVCRGVNFHRGLRTGNLDETLQTGHPGVITMWLGVPWMGVDPTEDWLTICRNLDLADMARSTPPEDPAKLGVLLFAARRGVAVLTSLAIGVAFLLLTRLFNRRLALLAGALILVDPFYLAHSRLLHLDAIVAAFLSLSVISLAIALQEDHRGFLIFSGALSGLAMLNKSPAFIAMPFAAVVILLYCVVQRRAWRWLVRAGLTWGVPAVLTYVVLWPAMWVQPERTLTDVFVTAFDYASNPHNNDNFFWGQPRPDPGAAFYPVALVFRLTPWTLIGCLLAIPSLARRRRERDTLWILGSFVLLFTAFMTFGQKKFDRYLLPVFPLVQVLSAVGLLDFGDALAARWRLARQSDVLPVLLCAGVVALGITTVLPHAPYYLTCYNPLLGGLSAAVNVLLVGWGEGYDLAAGYLNTLPGADHTQAVTRGLPNFAPLFRGQAFDAASYDAATTDYVVIYLNEVQRRLGPDLLERYYDAAVPAYVGQIRGVDYVWVYQNRTHEPLMSKLDSHADPTKDAIVVSRPSLFVDDYRGPLPLYVLRPDWSEEEVLTTLQDVASRAERVWYVRYAQKNPDPRLVWIDFQWQTHAFLLDEQSYPDVDLFLWETKGSSPFVGTESVRRDLVLQFGDVLELRGYTLSEPTARWGREQGVVFDWRVLQDPDKYYASFVHVEDDAGRVWGQGDHWMMSEALLPTVGWKQGDVVLDRGTLSLSPGIPPGTYRLVLGVYDRLTDVRLPIVDDEGQAQGDSYDIGTLLVTSSRWKPSPDGLPIQYRRRIELSPALSLLGWGIDRAEARFGEPLSVSLYWQATDHLEEDYSAQLQLIDSVGGVWADGEFPLASGDYPTSQWEAGEALWRFCDLQVSQDAPTTNTTLLLALQDSTGQLVTGPIELTQIRIEGHYLEPPHIAYPQQARFGDYIDLVGFDVEPTTVSPEDGLMLTLYWRLDRPIARSYTVFAHLLGEGNVVRGQRDSVPHDGRYPTDRWRPGETVVDHYPIQVAPDTPAGEYQIEIGMYDWEAGAQRLPVFDASGTRQQEDRLLLDVKIQVRP